MELKNYMSPENLKIKNPGQNDYLDNSNTSIKLSRKSQL